MVSSLRGSSDAAYCSICHEPSLRNARMHSRSLIGGAVADGPTPTSSPPPSGLTDAPCCHGDPCCRPADPPDHDARGAIASAAPEASPALSGRGETPRDVSCDASADDGWPGERSFGVAGKVGDGPRGVTPRSPPCEAAPLGVWYAPAWRVGASGVAMRSSAVSPRGGSTRTQMRSRGGVPAPIGATAWESGEVLALERDARRTTGSRMSGGGGSSREWCASSA